MYIRIKQLKNQEYAYLIENQWNKKEKKIKKKVRAYLGKIYRPQRTNNLNLKQAINKELNEYFSRTELRCILLDLIKLELINHNFKQINETLENYPIQINLTTLKIYNKNTNKTITLQINQGFLNEFTINELFNFKPSQNKEDIKLGKILAKKLALTGISIKPEEFVSLFRKYKNL